MHTMRVSRSRVTVWRRLAIAAAAIAFTVGFSAVPSATAETRSTGPTASVVAPMAVISVDPRRFPSSGLFIPPHTRGDREFKGHGPFVFVDAKLNGFGTSALTVELCMKAEETKPDHTTAEGCSGQFPFFLAPFGECVVHTNVVRSAQQTYEDTDNDDDIFIGAPGAFVFQFRIVGDTDGSEAGTRTGYAINTRQMVVTTAPC